MMSLLLPGHASLRDYQVNSAVSRAESLITISDDVDTVMRKHAAILPRSLSSWNTEKSMADGSAESEQAFQAARCEVIEGLSLERSVVISITIPDSSLAQKIHSRLGCNRGICFAQGKGKPERGNKTPKTKLIL